MRAGPRFAQTGFLVHLVRGGTPIIRVMSVYNNTSVAVTRRTKRVGELFYNNNENDFVYRTVFYTYHSGSRFVFSSIRLALAHQSLHRVPCR
jgi:hypothetical protein